LVISFFVCFDLEIWVSARSKYYNRFCFLLQGASALDDQKGSRKRDPSALVNLFACYFLVF